MRYRVALRGIPLGEVELPDQELATGMLEALPSFESIRSVIRDASRSLLALGFFGAAAQRSREDSDLRDDAEGRALAKVAALELELQDQLGAIIPATFVNIIEPPDGRSPMVIARFRDRHARVAAVRSPRADPDSAGERPDA